MSFDKSELNTVGRLPQRASYDKQTIKEIIQQAKIAHVAWSDPISGLPQCVPMLAALDDIDGDFYLYFHGYPSSRFTKSLSEPGTRIVATFTIMDGYVLALAHFHHSMNYRSASLHGYTCPIGSLTHEIGFEASIKADKMKLVVEAAVPGRWEHARQPNDAELNGTGLIRILVESGSAKIRTGPPKDDKQDLDDQALTAKTWTGVVPVQTVPMGDPIPTPDCHLPIPDHVRALY